MSHRSVAALSLITLLSGCAVSNVNTSPGPSAQAVQNASVVTPQDRILHSYMMQVNQIVAGHVRIIRERQERIAMKKAGHPVALPTGACRAVAVILANGTVVRADLAQCASEALGKVMLEAVHNASPFGTGNVHDGKSPNGGLVMAATVTSMAQPDSAAPTTPALCSGSLLERAWDSGPPSFGT
ncbi:hypothetical protein GL267_006050 [Acidithiobacillus ferrianus]|uniref:Lipoprotein n=2 Tax=Acidithiobacillus ferrianus TaxID=2678518 RepID=A0A845U7K9_9PROT|nr:hypothetical protein [Acidithiobacillus ferrianus]NDU41821.1 hypothetical protein [Acidithiobacillus ferrianus]